MRDSAVGSAEPPGDRGSLLSSLVARPLCPSAHICAVSTSLWPS